MNKPIRIMLIGNIIMVLLLMYVVSGRELDQSAAFYYLAGLGWYFFGSYRYYLALKMMKSPTSEKKEE